MKSQLLTMIFSMSLISLSTAHAYPQAQDGAKILQDKAISYAMLATKDTHFDIKAASQELSQNALDLGKMYSGKYELTLRDITSSQCMDELSKLGIDSGQFLDKALAQQYKTVFTVNGNQVMMIAAGAGELTYTVIDQGGFCTIDKSIHDAYWSANIIRLSIDGLNVTFS